MTPYASVRRQVRRLPPINSAAASGEAAEGLAILYVALTHEYALRIAALSPHIRYATQSPEQVLCTVVLPVNSHL